MMIDAYWSSFISQLYEITVIITLIAYLPQIIALLRAHDQTRVISLTTWFTWTFTSFVALIYGIYIVMDDRFVLMGSVNFAGCATVFSLAMYNRFFRFKEENNT